MCLQVGYCSFKRVVAKEICNSLVFDTTAKDIGKDLGYLLATGWLCATWSRKHALLAVLYYGSAVIGCQALQETMSAEPIAVCSCVDS